VGSDQWVVNKELSVQGRGLPEAREEYNFPGMKKESYVLTTYWSESTLSS